MRDILPPVFVALAILGAAILGYFIGHQGKARFEQMFNEQTEAVSRATADSDRLNDRLVSADNRVSDLEKSLVRRETEAREATGLLAKRVEELNAAREQALDQERLVQRFRTQVDNLKQQVATANETVQEREQFALAAETRATRAESALAPLRQTANELRTELSNQTSLAADTEKLLVEANDERAALEEKIAALETAAQAAADAAEASSSAIDNTELVSEIETLNQQLDARNAEMDALFDQYDAVVVQTGEFLRDLVGNSPLADIIGEELAEKYSGLFATVGIE